MAYCIATFYPGGTKAQYDAEIAVVHPHGGASLPAGQRILLPIIRSPIKNWLTSEPQANCFEVDHL